MKQAHRVVGVAQALVCVAESGVPLCGRLEVLRKPVAVWSHLDVDFAAEVAEAAAIGEELGAGALVPTRPRGMRRVRMHTLLFAPILAALCPFRRERL